MQERPNKLVLLTAIARFLNEEARPALADPRLAFRALIAANLASIVASETLTEDGHVLAELRRLRALFDDTTAAPVPVAIADRRALVSDLNVRLARALRSDALSDESLRRATAHVRETLRDKLSVDNPRFDTAAVIEWSGSAGGSARQDPL